MILLFGLMFGLLLIGMPVYAALGIASLTFVFVFDIPVLAAVQKLFGGLNSFPLLAVPFFILAGNLMNRGGITDRLFAFARSAVGHVPGGLGHVNIVASVIFSGMSGTALADAAGLGTVELKAMKDAGYDKRFAVGITAASSTIGPLIPPSLPMVIYGVAASASIGQLFLAGIIPGLIMAGSLHIMVLLIALRSGMPRDPRAPIRVVAVNFVRGLPALFAPVIIIGGIAFGVFTPTEAAVAASLYALLISFLVYRALNWRGLLDELLHTFETTAVTMVMLGSATLFGWLLVREGAARDFAAFMVGFVEADWMLMIILNLVLLITGMFMDPIAIILVATPLLLPVLDQFGIDRVHFGVVMVLNLMIGLMTPPIGVLAFVMARLADLSFAATVRACLPFMLPLIFVLVLISTFPGLAMWLPTLLFR